MVFENSHSQHLRSWTKKRNYIPESGIQIFGNGKGSECSQSHILYQCCHKLHLFLLSSFFQIHSHSWTLYHCHKLCLFSVFFQMCTRLWTLVPNKIVSTIYVGWEIIGQKGCDKQITKHPFICLDIHSIGTFLQLCSWFTFHPKSHQSALSP